MSEVAVSERRQALREIAKERAGIQGKALSQTYPEEDGRGQQGTEGGMPFEQISPGKIILEGRRNDDSAFNWTQFAPFKREKKKAKSMNTATIWLMARREIAQVWREAKGIKERNPRVDILEREAAMYGEKQEEERRRKEEAKAEFEKQRFKVDEVLKIISQKILEEKDNLTAEKTVALIEDAFGATGKVYDVQWREDGCDIWIEPWEKRWSRQKRELPTIYKIEINDELEMVSYDLVEDEEVRLKVNEQMLANQLNQLDESPDEDLLGADEDIEGALEKKLADVGRLVELKRLDENAWVATVELWEQMRIRNIERKGEGPIETEAILAKVVDGTITTSVIKGNKSLEEKATEGSTERSVRVAEGCPANSGEESKFELGAAQQK